MDVCYSTWASQDLRSAVRYYFNQSPTIAKAFLDEIAKVEDLIASAPQAGAIVGNDIRRVIVQRFPFTIIYAVEVERILILSVGHQRQHPDYWKNR